MKIRYRSGYKYQLAEDFAVQSYIYSNETITTEYIRLSKEGYLVVKKGYAWDGPSGLARDTLSFMRASLAHDALYQLFRMGQLSSIWRSSADKLLHTLCLKDGMWKVKAWLAYRTVRKFARGAALPKNIKKVMEAGI